MAIDQPHPSVQRLLDVAIRATTSKRRPVSDWAGLAAALKVTPQVMTNWKKRGISAEAALKAEQAFGCSAVWLLTGKHPPTYAAPASSSAVVAREPHGAWPAHHEVSASEWQLLQDIKALPEEDRSALTSDVQARAGKWRRYAQEVLKRHGANGDAVPDAVVREHLPPPPSKK